MFPAVINKNQGLNGFGAWVARNKSKIMTTLKSVAAVSTIIGFPAFGVLIYGVSQLVNVGFKQADVISMDDSTGMNGLSIIATDSIVPATSFITTRSTIPASVFTPIVSTPAPVVRIPATFLPVAPVAPAPVLVRPTVPVTAFTPVTPAPATIFPTVIPSTSNAPISPVTNFNPTPVTPVVLNSLEPTTADQGKLDPWVDNKLQPYFNALMVQLSQVFVNTDPNQQVAGINQAILQMDIVEDYFRDFDDLGLSDQGKAARLDLIQEVFAPARKVISDAIAQHPNQFFEENYSYQFDGIDQALFSGILTTSNLTGHTYNTTKYVGTEDPKISTNTSRLTDAVDSDTVTTVQNTTADATSTDAPQPTNNDTLKILGFIGIGIVAIKVLKGSKTTNN